MVHVVGPSAASCFVFLALLFLRVFPVEPSRTPLVLTHTVTLLAVF